jgi:methylated-DNA-protein-cysteine methyltransferase-like protein
MTRASELEQMRERIWQLVFRIPAGRVATYGQISKLSGLPHHARMVGRVLRNLPAGSKLPWHRVVNAEGRLSTGGSVQRELLEREGVVFMNGRIDLKQYRWAP